MWGLDLRQAHADHEGGEGQPQEHLQIRAVDPRPRGGRLGDSQAPQEKCQDLLRASGSFNRPEGGGGCDKKPPE